MILRISDYIKLLLMLSYPSCLKKNRQNAMQPQFVNLEPSSTNSNTPFYQLKSRSEQLMSNQHILIKFIWMKLSQLICTKKEDQLVPSSKIPQETLSSLLKNALNSKGDAKEKFKLRCKLSLHLTEVYNHLLSKQESVIVNEETVSRLRIGCNQL